MCDENLFIMHTEKSKEIVWNFTVQSVLVKLKNLQFSFLFVTLWEATYSDQGVFMYLLRVKITRNTAFVLMFLHEKLFVDLSHQKSHKHSYIEKITTKTISFSGKIISVIGWIISWKEAKKQ